MELKNNSLETDFNSLFKPRSVAHVGASAKQVTGRFNFTEYLLQLKFEGNIYPVNPKYDEILDLKCYPDLCSIPGEIDIAILAIPADNCAEILRDVPIGKIKFVVIHTSGFSEIDKNELEEEILQLACEKGFRVVGPNCMGIYSQQGRVGFWEDHYEAIKMQGTVGMISQSGGHAINLIRGGIDTNLHYDKVLSLGNQLDLTINEVLEFMGNDDDIGVIGVYVEDIGDGREFTRILKDVTRRKPVVIWKGGITEVGKAAAATHTSSIAGNEEVFSSAMRQSGAVMAENKSEFLQLLRLFQPKFKLPNENLAIISPGGGNTVSASDMFSKQPNVRLPRLSEETQEKLKNILPEENVDIKNPVDTGGAGVLILHKIVNVIIADQQVESLVVFIEADFLSHFESVEKQEEIMDMMTDMLKETSDKSGKPIHILSLQHRRNNENVDKFRRLQINKYNEKQIPYFIGSFLDAAVIYSKLAWYRKYLDSLSS